MDAENAMLRVLGGIARNGYEVTLSDGIGGNAPRVCVEFREPLPIDMLAALITYEFKNVED